VAKEAREIMADKSIVANIMLLRCTHRFLYYLQVMPDAEVQYFIHYTIVTRSKASKTERLRKMILGFSVQD
jgi:hypothetical protein